MVEQQMRSKMNKLHEKTVVYEISEIFNSIQGEGSWLGIPTTFIRLAKCNLKCEWCDTKFSWKEGKPYLIDQILEKIQKKHVVLTGGEPAIQNLKPLVRAIKKLDKKIKIAIETNGTQQIPEEIDWVVVSPKPDSDFIIVPSPNELKYVVDKQFSIDVIPKKFRYTIPIWLQPNAYDLEKSRKKCYELAMNNEYLRVGIQLHRIYQIQ